jgi:hypothetical protein
MTGEIIMPEEITPVPEVTIQPTTFPDVTEVGECPSTQGKHVIITEGRCCYCIECGWSACSI